MLDSIPQTNKSQNQPYIQYKLKVGQPNDRFETEADLVADQVMQMNDTNKMQMQPVEDEEESIQAKIQMQAVKEEEESIQMKPEEEEEESLQMKPAIQKSTNRDQNATSEIGHKLNSTKGSGKALPNEVGTEMGRKIGSDFSETKIHTDSKAVNMSRQLGAQAFTHGNDIYFNSGKYNPDSSSGKHLLAHELTHVIQQNGYTRGVTKPNKSNANPNKIKADGLSRKARSMYKPTIPVQAKQVSHSPKNVIQRFAFINEVQVPKTDPSLDAKMMAMASDTLVRNYIDKDEFKKHAANKTDYIGNLADLPKFGVWLRFNPAGINILGENHTQVTLQQVTPAVGTTNFIRERFSSDEMSSNPEMKAVYEQENQGEFKKMGIDKEPDKQKFGGESLFPKMGVALVWGLPYFQDPTKVNGIKAPNYLGKPLQRYVKIAWGWSKDNVADVKAKKAAKKAVSSRRDTLATVHASVEALLNPFISSLAVDGYLGDELGKPANSAIFAPLNQFALAFTDVIVEMAATEPSSRLTAAKRTALSSGSVSPADKEKLFSEWRNHYFQDIVNAAAKSGVRYAGMGKAHLQYLISKGLPSGGHPYDMISKDINAFEAKTNKLKKIAK